MQAGRAGGGAAGRGRAGTRAAGAADWHGWLASQADSTGWLGWLADLAGRLGWEMFPVRELPAQCPGTGVGGLIYRVAQETV